VKMTINHQITWILFPAVLVFFIGCSSTPKSTDTASQQEISTTDEQIFMGDTVEMSYDPNVIMKRAESFFDKESYAEAIVEYKHFLDLHRRHVLAPYAQYKIGVSHFKQFRTVDRDPEPLNLAIQSFEKLLEEFPQSRYETDGKDTIRICREQLAQRHLMVGQFYFRRSSFLAAAHRFEKVIKEYPELESAGDAMFHLAKTYQDLGMEEWSQEWLIALINEYPNNPYRSAGQTLLAKLHKDNPTLLASLSDGPSKTDDTLKPQSTSSPEEAIIIPEQEPLFSFAGILPTTTTPTTLNVATAAESHAHVSCTIGAWCDSQSELIPASPAELLSSRAISCKTGEWC
jgi:outer membrane protein assembly factor BamD